MSKYEIDVWEYADTFKNLDTNETFGGEQVCELLEQKDQRIAELEEQLANAIVPKFKVGQNIWYIYGKNIKNFTISKIEIEIRINPLIAYSSPYIYQYEENCFATKEDAEAKLN